MLDHERTGDLVMVAQGGKAVWGNAVSDGGIVMAHMLSRPSMAASS